MLPWITLQYLGGPRGGIHLLGARVVFLTVKAFSALGLMIIQAPKGDPCLARGFTGCQGIHPET